MENAPSMRRSAERTPPEPRGCASKEDNLAVDGGLKDRTLGFQFFTKLCRIDEVAIVTDGDLATAGVDDERLRVLDRA